MDTASVFDCWFISLSLNVTSRLRLVVGSVSLILTVTRNLHKYESLSVMYNALNKAFVNVILQFNGMVNGYFLPFIIMSRTN